MKTNRTGKWADSRNAGEQGLVLAAALWLAALGAPAQTLTVLYAFSGVPSAGDGGNPAGLMQGTNGNFYVSGVNEGTNEYGAICQLKTSGAMKPLYSFKYSTDGANPSAALVQGTNGLFYGAAQIGGTNGYGTIFNISSNGTFNSLYSFAKVKPKGTLLTNADGATPSYALVLGTNGNFYGTAEAGGTNGYGTVFQITHQGKMTVFYSFSNSVDGATPKASLLQSANGILYGTTTSGGSNGYGTVFAVTAAGKVTPIYSFTNGIDGATPEAALIKGNDGKLYGTCTAGGTNGTGTIFRITTNGILTPLYSFTAQASTYPYYNNDGASPRTLVLGADGNFYGVAYDGGQNGSGTVFQFTQGGVLNPLYSFNFVEDILEATNTDGAAPIELLQATDGNFYGTAYYGGTNGWGSFFRIGLPPQITAQPVSQAVALHGNASFTLAATGSSGCQWQFDNNNLPNATNYTLSLTNVQLTNAGYYQAILTNANGATPSAVVTLSVTNVPLAFATGGGALSFSGGQLSIVLTNLAGQGAIVIEASTDLMNWTPIFTNPPAFGSLDFTDPDGAAYAYRYYRALTQ
ncbi:MAG: choice-of-anchor tandem repeat GloVer-containing protein [Verrucomicrobiota bacterium]|jgi:uncharacterized repeat protein (TIGR03803 family)